MIKVSCFPIKSLLTIALILGVAATGIGQSTLIYGRVVDAITGSPISFGDVYFKGSTIGVSTDELGSYTIETDEPFDTLSAGVLGYVTKDFLIRVGENQELNIELSSADYALDEIVVIAGEDPAYDILKEVLKNKPNHDPSNFENHQFSSYNKVQFDLNNFTDKIKKNFLFRPFPFIWEYQDSMPNGVRYLPFLLKENVRSHYVRKDPNSTKEVIEGQETVQFFKGPKIEEFIEELYLNPNIYNSYISILNKSFPSPLNPRLNRHYRYYLADNQEIIDSKNCHKIKFIPLGKSDVAFTGHIYIEENSYAVKQVDLSFSIDANINFVRSFFLQMKYNNSNESGRWTLNETDVLADFTVAENSPELTGFFGRRHSTYTNYEFDVNFENVPINAIENVIVADSVDLRDDSFWETHRSDSLTQEERDISILVDTIQASSNFQTVRKIFTVIGTGWLPLGPIDLGNVFTFYSHNKIEGSRAKIGFRTTDQLSQNISLQGYGAYGFRDKKFKYGGDLAYTFSKTRTTQNSIGISHRKDIDQIGRSYNIIPIDHVLSSLLVTQAFENRILTTESNLYLERQWFTGMVTRLSFFDQSIEPVGSSQFIERVNNDWRDVPKYYSTGFSFAARLAYLEGDVNAKFDDDENRFFMTARPVISVAVESSLSAINAAALDYTKVRLRIEHQQKLNKLGYLDYRIELGKIWGDVPYPYLGIPIGNQSILNDDVSFNLMNYAEFASDTYASVHLEHHLEGLLFNQIPLVRDLKWRLFIFGKAFLGTFEEGRNEDKYVFPSTLYPIKEPYFEVGFGIENIFKLGRVDFTWRLSYLDHEDVYKFLPKPSFQFRF